MVMKQPNSHRFWLSMLLLVCFVLPVNLANAALTASVDRTVISKNDIIQLTIRSDKGPIEQANFSALEKNFSVINKRRSNQISIINGHQKAIYDLTLSLFPIPDGTLTIPAFKSQGESSQPIQIKISTGITDADQSPDQVFLKTDVSKQEVYVQEQLLFTLRLFHAVGLSEAQLTPLVVENAVVRPLGEQKKYQTVRNGIRHSVIEQQYAVTPEKSGQLRLPELVFTGRTSNRSTYGQSSQYVRTRSTAHVISVLSKPTDYPSATPWLPTSALNIADSWNKASPQLTVGEPVTRTLTLSALNLDAAQLPDLHLPAVRGLKMYPDQAQSESNVTAAGLIGQRSFSTAIVPTQAGDIEIPAIRVVWWNTDLKQLEETVIPARKLAVLAATNPTIQTTASTPELASAAPAQGTDPQQNDAVHSGIWSYLTLLFALLWLVTGFMWWRVKQRVGKALNTSVSTELPLEQRKQNLKSTYKIFKNACQKNEPKTARQALLNWFRLSQVDTSIQHLMDITQQYQDNELTSLISVLESYLYGKEKTATTWQGAPLLAAIERLEKSRQQSSKNSASNKLQPLYPF